MKMDFLTISQLTQPNIFEIFDLAKELKTNQKQNEVHHQLKGQTLAMIFQKPSARTRISFEVGMYQLGGHALYLSPSDIGLGKRESVADVARVVSRYCDGIMARLFGHEMIVELAQHSRVPVINGLTDLLHPCQIMADMLTVQEHLGTTENLKITYIGDGNNVANSWINLAGRLPMTLHLGVPEGYAPNAEILKSAQNAGISDIKVIHDAMAAVKDANVVYTDVWASMGQEAEAEARKKIFQPFQVNQKLIDQAHQNCIVLHCLPAHRGDEITDEVIDGPHSVVFDEAENRLHVQKAIMVKLMQK